MENELTKCEMEFHLVIKDGKTYIDWKGGKESGHYSHEFYMSDLRIFVDTVNKLSIYYSDPSHKLDVIRSLVNGK